MANNYYWLPKFDPDADYIVAAWPTGFTVSGFQPKPGQAFDKASVNSRMLEELYLKRWIKLAVIVPTAVAQVMEERAKFDPIGVNQCKIPTAPSKRTRPRKHAAA